MQKQKQKWQIPTLISLDNAKIKSGLIYAGPAAEGANGYFNQTMAKGTIYNGTNLYYFYAFGKFTASSSCGTFGSFANGMAGVSLASKPSGAIVFNIVPSTFAVSCP